jgi:endonuclease/exonuclease/phosphatase family metal-dependent hydrolase
MQVRVLTYNTFLRPYLIKTNEDDYKQERLDDMVIDFKDFDIVCLQECFDTFSHRQFELITKLGDAGFKYVSTSDKPGLCEPKMIDGGIVILSKYPIVESKFYDYGTMGQSDGLSKKGLLYARIRIVNKTNQDSGDNNKGVIGIFK